jgi:hypothetical protein
MLGVVQDFTLAQGGVGLAHQTPFPRAKVLDERRDAAHDGNGKFTLMGHADSTLARELLQYTARSPSE